MFPKHYRLPGYKIPLLVKNGRRIQGRITTIVVSKIDSSDITSQITVICPVRLSKKAVYRNRTRRLLREAIHHKLTAIKPQFEIIVIAKKLLEKEKLSDIEPEIFGLLQKADLLKT